MSKKLNPLEEIAAAWRMGWVPKLRNGQILVSLNPSLELLEKYEPGKLPDNFHFRHKGGVTEYYFLNEKQFLEYGEPIVEWLYAGDLAGSTIPKGQRFRVRVAEFRGKIGEFMFEERGDIKLAFPDYQRSILFAREEIEPVFD